MELTKIEPEKLKINTISLWEKQWLLLTSGDFSKNHFNCMTIAWGSIGCMWNKPFIQVVVRPTRYTYEFMEKYPDFTVCGFPENYRSALQYLGSRSGRNENKIQAAGLTPSMSEKVAAPIFEEANLLIECRKIYVSKFEPQAFIDPKIENLYSEKDYHRIYFGEIILIKADPQQYT